eukprot:m.84632 g.84632  ORF g.84632 m.84632 type:complete len:110 (+) comp36413_c0_seq15:497-826(+)
MLVFILYNLYGTQDAQTGLQLQAFFGHQKCVTSCYFDEVNSRIVSSSWDKTLKFWDAETATELVEKLTVQRPRDYVKIFSGPLIIMGFFSAAICLVTDDWQWQREMTAL